MKAKELKIKRKEKGYSQVELAKLIGVSERTIVNYEKGETIPDTKTEILQRVLEVENILNESKIKYNNDNLTDSEKIDMMFSMMKKMYIDMNAIKLSIGLKEEINKTKKQQKSTD